MKDVTARSLSTLSVWVDNEPGVLARVIGLFSSRGYNIESLSVSAISSDGGLSRMTIVTSGNAQVLAQIEAQLDRLVPVYQVSHLGAHDDCLMRDLALLKFAVPQEHEDRLRALVDSHEASIIDETPIGTNQLAVVVQLVSSSKGVDDFVEKASFLSMIEMSRTGVTAMSRGDALFQDSSRRI